jgi:hypothetical protein
MPLSSLPRTPDKTADRPPLADTKLDGRDIPAVRLKLAFLGLILAFGVILPVVILELALRA